MSKKLILFLMVLLFGSTSFLRADEVTIGDPTSTTTNSYLPTYSLYDYSFTQQIYTADEIGMGGTINDVTLWLKNTSSYARNFNIYMKEVSEVTFADGNAWVSMTAGDMVASGTLANGVSDPVATTFTLTTPFEYSGEGNLVICFQDVTGSWSSGAASVVMTGNGNQAIYAYRDGTVYDPTTPGVTGYVTANKSVVRLTIEGSGPVPPTPTGEIVITPNPFELGVRPTNGWMEPYAVRIENGGAPVTITANMSNTAGVEAFSMSEEINDVVLDTDETLAFTIDINTTAPAGEYTEQFTMFSNENSKDITTIPVTATFYTAGEADIVETAKELAFSYTAGVAEFNHTPVDIHPNYFGSQGMIANDAVYQFNLAKDALFTVNAGAGSYIGIYTKVLNFHPTMAVEPVAYAIGEMQDEILLAGQYYMIVAGDNFTSIEGTVEQMPAPTAMTAIYPADGATEIAAPVTLTWEGGENASEYQVLFGTSPVNMDVVLDWTVVDDNFGSYTVNSLQANTQYFWQIKARNTNGTVQTQRRGFTSTLTAPNTVTASEEEIFTDGSTLIKWKHSSGTTGDLPETQIGSGTSTNSYLPTYNLYNYSLSEQIYTGEEIGEAGYINSISFYPVGSITRNLKIYMANTDKETFTSGSDWVAMEADNLVFEGNVDMVANTWVTIPLDEPFEFDGTNLILAVTDHTGTWTSSISYYVFDATAQAINIYQDSAPYSAITPSGSGTVRNFKNQIILNKEGRGGEPTRSFIGYNVYYGDVKANTELITEKQYLLGNLPYNVEPGHNVSVTAVYDEGESALSSPVVVKVSGYGTFTGQVTELISGDPVAGVTVTFNGKDEFNNTVSFEGTTNLNGVYTINNVKAGNYIGTATLEGMEPRVSDPVELAYEGTETVDFVIHEEYKPVLSVYASEIDTTMSKVQWSLTTNISGGGTGGEATTFTESFESGIPADWTTIDADGDGYNWMQSSVMMAGYSITPHSGDDMVSSASYSGVALFPDNYLVTPQVNIANGSTFSFWACAQDASYPAEHFGVAISDDGTTFTMVEEWTMTAKGDGAKGPRGTNATGNYYQYSVDLSAYAGQKYIAIRHFNCTDMFYLNVDDAELSNGSKGRAVQEYAIYRKAILKETEVTPADSVFFGTTTDTLYADFDWNNREPGLYQYGVSAHYPMPSTKGNRDGELTVYEGSVENSTVPMYVSYFDEWAKTQYVIPASDLSAMAGSTINAMSFSTTNYNIPYTTVSAVKFYMTEVNYTTISSYVDVASTQVVYEGYVDFEVTAGGGMATITFDTPYSYNGGNLLIGCENTTNTNYRFIYFNGQTVSGASIAGSNSSNPANAPATQRDFIPQTTFYYEAGQGGSTNDDPVTPITWSNILPKNMETTVTVNAIVAAGTAEGATVNMTNTFENLAYTATLDETGTVTFADFRKGEYVVTVDLEGYVSDYAQAEVSIWDETEINATLTEICKPVDALNVSGTGYAMWTPVVPVDRVAEKYFVQLNGVFYGETTESFLQFEGLEEGTTYTAGVAVVYSTGMSAYVTKSFTYIGCEGVATQVEELAATNEPGDLNVVLTWNGAQPTPPTGGWTEDFEGGLNGWTVLTVNTDGGYWLHSSANPGGYDYTTYAHGGSGFAMCYSFIDYDGAYDTDSYLITPQMNSVSAGSTLTFWADNANDSYPENFSVCVATAANPTAADFTPVWSGGAKGAGSDGAAVRHTGTRANNWRQHTIDLSAYAGQNIWIAFHDVNYDMYEIWIDDVTFTTDAKRGTSFAAASQVFGQANTNMVSNEQAVNMRNDRDGNWYFYGDDVNATGIGASAAFYWAVMFPAGTYEGTTVTKVANYGSHNDTYGINGAFSGTVTIYNDGTSAPSNPVGSMDISMPDVNTIVEFEFPTPVTIDPSKNLWVVFYNATSTDYVASACNDSGDPNGRWVSLDGTTWQDLAGAGVPGYNWMIKVYVETGGGGTPTSSIVPNKFNIFVDGEIVGTSATASFTYEAPDFNAHEYTVVWVSANYEISCEATIYYSALPLGVEENTIVNAIYPNPTSGDLHINATAMKHISIINTMGQVVYNQDVNTDETVIDMAKFESGVYMVNIITENGTSVKRITVTK